MTRVALASFDRLPSAKGAARHILQNHAILSAAGMDVSLVTLGDAPVPGLRHLPIALSEPNYVRRALAFHEEARRVFERNAFDVHHVRSPWEGLAVPVGGPLVYEVNGLPSIESAYHHPALFGMATVREKLRRLELALLDRASLVLTPSSITADLLADLGAARDRVEVVPNAPVVPIAEAPPPPSEGPVRIAYLGTLAPWQGLTHALDALARLEAPFELGVLTPSVGRTRREFEKRVGKLGLTSRVRVAPPLEPEALGAWLATRHLALAPLVPCERNLVQGGMPLKLLDAMAVGLPVVAPDMPIVSEVLGPAHPTYRRHSTEDLVALLQHLATDATARNTLGAGAIERVRARFSPERQRDALLSAYRRVAPSSTATIAAHS